ncbi:MAG TPA: hypothetical protein VHM31_19690 [Polyangia bacterium]|nr:hypothetical protein [Polyangia bacterium]
MTRARSTLLASTLCLVTFASAAASAAPTFAPPPPTAPHLKSYSDWGALWWQWALQTPAANNPVLDTTGANCAVGQPVPGTFFLAGTFDGSPVTRTCTVPVGDAFLIPILSASYFAQQTDPPEQRTEAFVRSKVTCVEQNPTLSVTVDGVAIANPRSLLEKSTVFSVNLPADNVFGVPPQVLSPSVDEGYYAFLEPLSAGSHTVVITSSSTACNNSQNATYHLIVQGTVGTPRTCSGTQQLTLNNVDIQSTGAALTVSGNCTVTVNNSVLFGSTSAIVVHDQGHVIVNTSVVGGGPGAGGFAVNADGHGHVELRNSAVISPTNALGFAIISDSGGNSKF